MSTGSSPSACLRGCSTEPSMIISEAAIGQGTIGTVLRSGTCERSAKQGSLVELLLHYNYSCSGPRAGCVPESKVKSMYDYYSSYTYH